jgi:hypothetical protein
MEKEENKNKGVLLCPKCGTEMEKRYETRAQGNAVRASFRCPRPVADAYTSRNNPCIGKYMMNRLQISEEEKRNPGFIDYYNLGKDTYDFSRDKKEARRKIAAMEATDKQRMGKHWGKEKSL